MLLHKLTDTPVVLAIHYIVKLAARSLELRHSEVTKPLCQTKQPCSHLLPNGLVRGINHEQGMLDGKTLVVV